MLAFVPAWVPALPLGLVFLGYRQSLPRTVKPATLVVVALAMFGLSLYGVVGTFGGKPLALVAWGAGYTVTLLLGAKHFGSRGLRAEGASVRIPGSWVPLALILAIFTVKCALGFAAGVHSPMLGQAVFVAAISAILGALSGGFGARALAVHRWAAATSAASRELVSD